MWPFWLPDPPTPNASNDYVQPINPGWTFGNLISVTQQNVFDGSVVLAMGPPSEGGGPSFKGGEAIALQVTRKSKTFTIVSLCGPAQLG